MLVNLVQDTMIYVQGTMIWSFCIYEEEEDYEEQAADRMDLRVDNLLFRGRGIWYRPKLHFKHAFMHWFFSGRLSA